MKQFLFLFSILFFSAFCLAQQNPDVANGKKIFTTRCAACHNFKQKLVGPNLKDAHKRRSEAWITQFVKNSQAFIASGDADAVAIFNEFNQTAMPPHPDLTDANIKEVIAYIRAESDKIDASSPQATPSVSGGAGGASAKEPVGYQFISGLVYGLFTLIVIAMLILLYFLIEIKSRPQEN